MWLHSFEVAGDSSQNQRIAPVHRSGCVRRFHSRECRRVPYTTARRHNAQQNPLIITEKLLPSQKLLFYKPKLHQEISNHCFEMAPSHRNSTRGARLIADELIDLARMYRVLNKRDVSCRSCKRVLVQPVTGRCGHHRCLECTKKAVNCPCGREGRVPVSIDITAQDIVNQMQQPRAGFMRQVTQKERRDSRNTAPTSIDDLLAVPPTRFYCRGVKPNAIMTTQARLKYANTLIRVGKFMEAAPHLARVAAQSNSVWRLARETLIKTIYMLRITRKNKSLVYELGQMVRNQSTESWVRRAHLECRVCLETFTRPVTTKCGHTFCRFCINRLISYKLPCALCRYPLDKLDIVISTESKLVTSVLESMYVARMEVPLAFNEFFLFNCAVAFPKVPCPIMVMNPKYLHMLFCALYSGRPYLAMVNFSENNTEGGIYGTLIKVCDYIILKNGNCVLTTLGVYRFQLIKLNDVHGCDVGLITQQTDNPLTAYQLNTIYGLAQNTYARAVSWYQTVHASVKYSIESTYGSMPVYSDDISDDGPAWLWWLTVIAPINNEIKNLMLATKSVYKRLLVINRILQIIVVPRRENFLSRELRKMITES